MGRDSACVLGLVMLLPGAPVFAQQGRAALAEAKLVEPPRLLTAHVPAQPISTIGGGEVLLELTVTSSGNVSGIKRLRTTPPYTDFLTDAAATWRFAPATARFDKREVLVDAPTLVVGVFRPPSVYGGPSAATPPQDFGGAAPSLPQVASLMVPNYSPTLVGDGIVIIEIEMTARAEPREYRILTPQSGFDSAALAAVREWRFTPPTNGPPALYVYAVLGFRSPMGPTARPRPPGR
jgi:hypothetical protein